MAPGSTPRGSAASPSQPVARGATSHGWEKIPVQEPVRGPITKPQPGFRMGTGSARARRHRAASLVGVGATCREKLPRERGSGCPNTTGENTRSCSALCPQRPAPRPMGSASCRDTADTGVAAPAQAWRSLGAVPAAQSSHPQQSPLCQPQPCRPQQTSHLQGATPPRPRADPSHGHAGQGAATDPQTALGSSEGSQAGPWTTNLSHWHRKPRLGPPCGRTPAATLEAQAGK